MATDGDKTVQRVVETRPDGATIETKTYAGKTPPFAEDHKVSVGSVLKHPTTGTAGILVALIGAITLQPQLLPYALADEVIDVEQIKTIIVDTVNASQRVATLQSDIKQETIQIGSYDAQILSGLCIPSLATAAVPNPEKCILEKAFKAQAESRKQSYQDELNSVNN